MERLDFLTFPYFRVQSGSFRKSNMAETGHKDTVALNHFRFILHEILELASYVKREYNTSEVGTLSYEIV